MKRKFPVGVVVLEKSRDTAEALVNGLRRTGMSLRPRWVNRAGALAESLRRQRWDLLLSGLESPVIPPAQVVSVVRQSNSDLALIGTFAGSGNDQTIEEALGAGFHDVVSLDRQPLLKHVVTRELAHLEQRRRARKLESEVKASAQTLQELIHGSERALAVVHGGQILQANPMWMDLMAIPPGEVPRGRPLSDYVAEDDRDEFSRALMEQTDTQTSSPMVEIELTGRRADGTNIPLSLDIIRGTFEERAALLIIARGAATVEPGEMQPQAEVNVPSQRDSLIQAIDADRKSNTGGALACILIENLYALQEVLGLSGSDRLSELLLQRIKSQADENAIVAQVGADAIGIYVPGRSLNEMRERARQIASGISRDVINIGEHTVRPACLTGVATVSEEHSGAMEVLEAAYSACRQPVVPGPDLDTAPESEMRNEEIAEDLVEAMSDGRLSLVFQPIIRLTGEPIDLYEVFIRLVSREGVPVPARAVVSAAKHADLDTDLDLWVVERAIGIIETRKKEGHNTHLFVKLSDRCMDDIRLPLTITRVLKERNVAPGNLIVELSEVAASGNLKKSNAFVESLQKIGCSTALDHFGLSLSAFQLLEDVPARFLKLDVSLVNRMAEDEQAYNQVVDICRRAKNLKKETIASYLDNPQCLPKLYEAGVDFAQGYYIQEPSESMDFEFSILVE